MSDAPKTVPEQLDAAETGEEFATALGGFFDMLAAARELDE